MRSLFPWTEVSKAVQKPNGGQEVPEIALSVGSKLRAFVFAKCPYTSPYTHAFVRVCVYIHNYIHIIYMTEAPRVLHFSAFIDFVLLDVLCIHLGCV